MRAASLIAMAALLLPAAASAHPHVWVSQAVRVTAKDGKYTHVEIEWRFDPESSEDEIPAIDEDKDGNISAKELELLARDTMESLQKFGFQTWLNTGGKDFQPTAAANFTARIQSPATFTPPDWDRSTGDGDKMPENKRQQLPVETRTGPPRNLVYTFRFALPTPSKSVTVTTYDADDFIRFDVDKATLPPGCRVDKHPNYKSEFVPGQPVFADRVSCRLP